MILVAFSGHRAQLTDLSEGSSVGTVEGDDHFEFGFPGIASGT